MNEGHTSDLQMTESRTTDRMTNPSPAAAEPKPGEAMPDGTLYAGRSPDTGKPLYTTPADALMLYTVVGALKYAARLDAHGRLDWRVPTKDELDLLYRNRDALGGFDSSGSFPASWYWSSSQRRDYEGWSQRFTDGGQGFNLKFLHSRLRCVR